MRRFDLPTLEDVAAAANVSTATVSRCLNSPDRVSAQTRDRVMRIVAELGYAPNFGARALAARRTNTFGAIIPTMENAIFARGLQAFQEELVAHQATMLVASSSYDPDIERAQIRTMIERGADGLLLIGTDRSADIYAMLAARGVPVVIAWTCAPHSPHSCVGFDNAAAARQLAERALDLGHRRFAFISAETASNDRARDRVTGVTAALRGRGIDPAAMTVVETPYSIENGANAFRQIMESVSPRPTVVMCGNDVLATGALKMAGEMALDVPDDISITGFDDIELATVVRPALTTVHVPHREMGLRAATLLLRLASGESVIERVELSTRLVERESLGAPSR